MEFGQTKFFVKLLYLISRLLDWTKIAGLTQNIYKPANVGVVEEDVVVLPMLDSPVWTAPPKNEGTCGDDGFSVVELNLGVLGTTLSSVASSNCPTWDISLYYINAMPIWHKYWNFYILYYHYELKCRTNSRKFGGTNIKEKTYFFFYFWHFQKFESTFLAFSKIAKKRISENEKCSFCQKINKKLFF